MDKTYQDLIVQNQKVYTKTTIEDFEKTMDKYYVASNDLAQEILCEIFGEENYYVNVHPFFIDYRFILSKKIDNLLVPGKPFYKHSILGAKIKQTYYLGIPVDIILRLGPPKPRGFQNKWNGLQHFRNNGIEPCIDQVISILGRLNYKVYYELKNNEVLWYAK